MIAIASPLRGFVRQADDLLRGSGHRRVALIQIMAIGTACGGFYGAVMGTSAGIADGHWMQIVYSALKVPLLIGATFAISVPSYFVLYSLAGLRESFMRAITSIMAAQAAVAITLAALSPFTALLYASSTDYTGRILFNGAMFAIASMAGQFLIRKYYEELIATNRRHLLLLRVWLYVYSFVGIQMGWLLRPFVGEPSLETHFFRSQMWGNAYVVVGHMVWQFVSRVK